MYKKHKNFESIPDGKTLWRYLDLAKYVSLISQKQLFFCSATKFEDPFEGMLNNATKAALHRWYLQGVPADKRTADADKLAEQKLGDYLDYIHRTKPLTVINSWHQNDNESFAMWKIYSNWNTGIAVTTTFRRLADCFAPAKEDIYIGKVHYINETRDLIDLDNDFRHFMVKRKQFAYEQEVRCLHQVAERQDPDLEQINQMLGIRVDIDIDTLLDCIYISPQAERWLLDVVLDLNEKYGIKAKVKQSTLLSSDNY